MIMELSEEKKRLRFEFNKFMSHCFMGYSISEKWYPYFTKIIYFRDKPLREKSFFIWISGAMDYIEHHQRYEKSFKDLHSNSNPHQSIQNLKEISETLKLSYIGILELYNKEEIITINYLRDMCLHGSFSLSLKDSDEIVTKKWLENSSVIKDEIKKHEINSIISKVINKNLGDNTISLIDRYLASKNKILFDVFLKKIGKNAEYFNKLQNEFSTYLEE